MLRSPSSTHAHARASPRKGSAVSRVGHKAVKHQAATTIQRAWRAHIARLTAKCERRRHELAIEFVNLEKTYASNLAYMRINYEEPLREKEKSSGPITHELVSTIFQNMQEILKCHQGFSSLLQNRLKTWGPKSTLGDCFIAYSVKFGPLYRQYVLGFSRAMETFNNSMENNSAFRTIIQTQRAQDPNAMSLTLEDMLMMPVQRMPRYELLLHSMVRNTRREHEDSELLTAAHDRIQKLCTDFNASKSVAERKHRETRLLRELDEYEVPRSDHRELKCECDVVEMTRTAPTADDVRKPRRLFLFNDMLVCAKSVRVGKAGEPECAYSPKWMVTLGSTRARAAAVTPVETLRRVVAMLETRVHEQRYGTVDLSPVELPSSLVQECDGSDMRPPPAVIGGKPRHMRAVSDTVVPSVGRAGSRVGLLSSSSQADSNSVTSETSRPEEDLTFEAADREAPRIPPPRPGTTPRRRPTRAEVQNHQKRRRSLVGDLDLSLKKALGIRRSSSIKSTSSDDSASSSIPEGCFAGDDLLLWVSDELRLDRESAQILCQELVDRSVIQRVPSGDTHEFQPTYTQAYQLRPNARDIIEQPDPADRIRNEINDVMRAIDVDRSIIEAINRMELSANSATWNSKAQAKKKKELTARSIESHNKQLQALRDKLALYTVRHGLHICTYGRDGFSMYTRTIYVATEEERKGWIEKLCSNGPREQAQGGTGVGPDKSQVDGLFTFKHKGSKRLVRAGSGTKYWKTVGAASMEQMQSYSLASLRSGSRDSIPEGTKSGGILSSSAPGSLKYPATPRATKDFMLPSVPQSVPQTPVQVQPIGDMHRATPVCSAPQGLNSPGGVAPPIPPRPLSRGAMPGSRF